MTRGNQAIKQGRDGSPSAPKPQARSAVPCRAGVPPAIGEMRPQAGGVFRSQAGRLCDMIWDPCGEASLPFGFDWRCRADGVFGASVVTQGRDGSPSGPKLQARSAVPCSAGVPPAIGILSPAGETPALQAVYKFRTPVSKNGTAVPKIGTLVPNLGTSVIKFGTAPLKTGTALTNFGRAVRKAGSEVMNFGTEALDFTTGAMKFRTRRMNSRTSVKKTGTFFGDD